MARTPSHDFGGGYQQTLPAEHIGETPLREVREIIHLPEYDNDKSRLDLDPEIIEVPPGVVQQLHNLVSIIASLYQDNPFHSFQHASHVVMSVTKLMSRIVAPSSADENNTKRVSNAQLVKEGLPIAFKYGQRSVAEQNSLDLSWDLLMKPEHAQLRTCLFEKEEDLVRFRQLVVNSVMATDIVDKDLKALRNGRWEKAFKNGSVEKALGQDLESPRDSVNRKATIVIEHIIQASDISHTMQHWHVYRKWNQNLFEELYAAYLNGRMEKDPVEFWYKGEFGFFDFYIIPLTQKLKDCGVFGISSDELLHHAKKNRAEWERQGEHAVAEMVAESRRKYGVKSADPIEVPNPIEC
ncbi:Guanylate cyclase [Seminavis robusta]|uniref:Guanylate cyclase n=1 Tax=Seminavis robusta TaxID=568900 RepID=A0A9N8D785_9STRA|nr:Guanylate cyclase [Seminavis robusta]|eukprot:Sro6_g004860.1 Guanylate cyclase (353) ;mRNA; f:32961-34607